MVKYVKTIHTDDSVIYCWSVCYKPFAFNDLLSILASVGPESRKTAANPRPANSLRRVHQQSTAEAPTKTLRRGRDSNPRYAFTYTRFPSVLLRPLGHLSALGSATRASRLAAAAEKGEIQTPFKPKA